MKITGPRFVWCEAHGATILTGTRTHDGATVLDLRWFVDGVPSWSTTRCARRRSLASATGRPPKHTSTPTTKQNLFSTIDTEGLALDVQRDRLILVNAATNHAAARITLTTAQRSALECFEPDDDDAVAWAELDFDGRRITATPAAYRLIIEASNSEGEAAEHWSNCGETELARQARGASDALHNLCKKMR